MPKKPLPRGRRPGPQPLEKKPFEERLFSGAKIARVLETKYQIQMMQFVRDYDDDTSRSPRTRALENSEVEAIQRFLKHRQITQLATDLACSISSAQARVTRFVLDHAANALSA